MGKATIGLRAAALAAAAAMVLAACGGGGDDGERRRQRRGGTGEPVKGGTLTFFPLQPGFSTWTRSATTPVRTWRSPTPISTGR